MAASNNQCTINSVTDIEIIMGKFTPICQRYTDVMAHKYYLQHLLLHRTNDATVLIQLTSVIASLQTSANSLQTIQVRMRAYVHSKLFIMCILQMKEDNGHPCLKVAPCQYKKIYYSRLPMNKSFDELDALCLLQLAARNWQDKKTICT